MQGGIDDPANACTEPGGALSASAVLRLGQRPETVAELDGLSNETDRVETYRRGTKRYASWSRRCSLRVARQSGRPRKSRGAVHGL